MRLLLDECLPRRLKRDLSGHAVLTAAEAGLAGTKDGALLASIEGRFDCFITMDKSMRFQQRLANRPFAIVVLRAVSNRYQELQPLTPSLLLILANIAPGQLHYLPER